MKGGLAVIHAALSALEAAGLLAKLPIAVVCVAEEEGLNRLRRVRFSGRGFRTIAERRPPKRTLREARLSPRA